MSDTERALDKQVQQSANSSPEAMNRMHRLIGDDLVRESNLFRRIFGGRKSRGTGEIPGLYQIKTLKK